MGLKWGNLIHASKSAISRTSKRLTNLASRSTARSLKKWTKSARLSRLNSSWSTTWLPNRLSSTKCSPTSIVLFTILIFRLRRESSNLNSKNTPWLTSSLVDSKTRQTRDLQTISWTISSTAAVNKAITYLAHSHLSPCSLTMNIQKSAAFTLKIVCLMCETLKSMWARLTTPTKLQAK